jgi:CDGSH-type Zn-finger protein
MEREMAAGRPANLRTKPICDGGRERRGRRGRDLVVWDGEFEREETRRLYHRVVG